MANALPIPVYKQWQELQKRKSDALETGDELLLTQVDAQILDFAKRNSVNLELPVTEEVTTGTTPPVPTGEPPKPEPGTFTVKEGGWGANQDPSTWTVTNMKDPATKFKVVDDQQKNVATEFTTHDNAQSYIDYAKWLKANPPEPKPGNGSTPTPTPPIGDGKGLDQFGIRKIFADGPNKIVETNFKIREFERHYQSNKPSENSVEYTNVSKDIIQNVEVTIYQKINGFKKEPDTISLKLGGPDHKDGARFWIIPDFSTSGDPKRTLEIEDPHPENHPVNPKPLTKYDSIVGKWFGYKGISYQVDDKTRHVESWIHFPVKDIDKVSEEQDKWQKYMEYDTDKEKKNYSKFLGKNTTSRLDGPKKGDLPEYKYASVREISVK